MSREFTGWLLDLYDDPQAGVVLWFALESGERLRLHQPFPIIFSAAGPAERLRAAWRWLQQQPEQVNLSRSQGHDLFISQPVTLLSIEVPNAAAQPRLFQPVQLGLHLEQALQRFLSFAHQFPLTAQSANCEMNTATIGPEI